jgi:hypothetical protein
MNPDLMLIGALAPCAYAIARVAESIAMVMIVRLALSDAPPSSRREILRGVGEAIGRDQPGKDDESSSLRRHW